MPVDGSNFLADANVDGANNILDYGMVKPNLFQSAVCP
jgi:hypothetical protein